MSLEKYFKRFRKNIVGINSKITTPYKKNIKIVYADWIASGRLYKPIEKKIAEKIGPYVANTHTEASFCGQLMTEAYHEAKKIIKKHVNASDDDVLITTGFGMTAAVIKLQRILGLKLCGTVTGNNCLKESEKPVVFVTHMEHHSNHTSWYETIADVVVLPPDDELLFDLNILEDHLKKYASRKVKIGAFTACSNVTGIRNPYREMAKLMHKYDGLCFIDFAASAPYDNINMHPENYDERLDAIYFSPHKFLGGPGSSGVLVFNKNLYKTKSPDQPGGGTVEWTNPWGEYQYINNIEVREDGGTPGFIQAMRTAFAIKLKEQMTTEKIHLREKELTEIAFKELRKIPNLHILADNVEDRLGVISFYIDDIHYNLVVKLLSDMFGIQVRGGCVCAGTYGHFLLHVDYDKSKKITTKISSGDLSEKPGWVRLSLHPTMTNKELYYIIDAINYIAKNYDKLKNNYTYNKKTNEFTHISKPDVFKKMVENWFNDID